MKRLIAAATLAAGLLASHSAAAQGYISELRQFEGQCPAGWMKAVGQIMQIVDNKPNFAMMGIRFGGDGQKTFALPRLSNALPGTVWCICINGQFPPHY
jgi:hypothetical protein